MLQNKGPYRILENTANELKHMSWGVTIFLCIYVHIDNWLYIDRVPLDQKTKIEMVDF